MNKSLLLLFLFFSVNLIAQNKYSEVVNVDSSSADELHSLSKMFVTNASKSGKVLTQLSDDANKTLVAKGYMDVEVAKAMGMSFPEKVWFKVTIASKDNRYKYSFDDFVLHYQAGTSRPKIEADLNKKDPPKTVNKKQWEAVKSQVDDKVKWMISDLKTEMKKK